MSIFNKILIGFVFVAALVFFFFAARDLKTHAAWRKCVADHEASIATAEEQAEELLEGKPDAKKIDDMGIRLIKLELEKQGRNRAQIWRGCVPRNVDGATGAVTVAIDSTAPHQIAKKTVLYVFDDNGIQQGGRYLGQFNVTEVDAKQVALQPSYKLTQAEIARLQRAKAPWSLYQNLPSDDHQSFADWDDATKKAMLPAATVAEYLQDGQPDKPARKLRDYEVIFKTCLLQRADMLVQAENGASDLRLLTAAVKDAEDQRKAFEDLVGKLKTELASCQVELKAVAAHGKAVADTLAQVRTGIDETMNVNRAAAAEIARIQLEATRRIDERARRMAQAGRGE